MPPITREPLLLLARLQRLPTTRYTWAFVLLLAGAFTIEAFDIGSLSVILPILKPLMQLSPVQVGLLVAASLIGLTIGMIPAGFLADRFGRKRVLIGGMLWYAGLTLVSALAPGFGSLLLLRGFSGLGMAPAFIVPYALVSEMVSSRTRAAFAGFLEKNLASIGRKAGRNGPVEPREIALFGFAGREADHAGAIVTAGEKDGAVAAYIEQRQFAGNAGQQADISREVHSKQ